MFNDLFDWMSTPEFFSPLPIDIIQKLGLLCNADNITLNSGSGGAVLATDDVGGNHYQLVKQVFGALDTATLVSTANPLPVDLRTDNLAGNLDVNLAASGITLTISGTVTANAGTGTLATQDTATLVDDAAFSPTTSRVMPVGFTFDDTTPDSVNEGDIGAARMSANRNVYMQLRDNAGNERGLNIDAAGAIAVTDGGGTLTIDNATLSVTGGGAQATALRVTMANDSSGVLAVTNTVLSVVGGGTEATAQRVTIANDSTGVLSIDDNGASITIDGTITVGTMANLTESLVDDAAFSPGGSRVLPVGFTFDDTTPDSVNEGDIGAARMSANRVVYQTIRDAAGNERGVNVNASNQMSVSVDNTATVTVSSLPNEGQQTMANSISVAIASDQSTLTVNQATASNFNGQMVGNIAHDGADSGNPVKIGGVARTANPTAVAAGDRADLFLDDMGKAVVYPIAPRDRLVVAARVSLTSTTETTLIAAGGAGVFRDLVQLIVSNEAATEARLDVRDVTAGTVMFSIDLAPDGGGAVLALRVPWPQATANSAWTVQLSAAVSTVYVSAIFSENN